MSVFKNEIVNIRLFKFLGTFIFLLFFVTDTSARVSGNNVVSITSSDFVFPAPEWGCTTPLGRVGTCINLKNCPALVNILKRPPVSNADLALLRRSQCDYEGKWPKVCCENEHQPMGTKPPPTQTPPRMPTTEIPPVPDVTRHENLRLLNHDLCGPITQGKIFNGNKTGVFDYPWMALIAYDVGKGVKEFRCGGSIINKRYILTAGHCVTELPYGLQLSGVRVGDHDIRKERDCDKDENGLEIVCAERYQDFGIENYHYYPGYRKSTWQDDIAIIRVDNDIDFRPASVRPICMPIGRAATHSQKKVTVTGWGATETSPRSNDLLRVLIAPVPNDECANIYARKTRIWYKQMCAGGRNGMDSCLGDSGGPLQAPTIYSVNGSAANVRYVQFGIVSFGLTTCGVEGYPGVYTRVPYYLDWILSSMRD